MYVSNNNDILMIKTDCKIYCRTDALNTLFILI